MKKQLRCVVTLAMILMFSLFGTAGIGATAVNRQPTERLTLNTWLQRQSQSDSEPAYQEHAALVMFKTTDGISLLSGESRLKSGKDGIDDITIEELWSFKRAPANGEASLKSVQGAKQSSTGGASYCNVALVTSETLSTQSLILKLKAREDVLYAEPNYRIHAFSVNDPYFESQWNMQSSDRTPNVMSIWGEDNQGTTGSSRIVAVVDTGVDYTHPDLRDRMRQNTHYPTLKGRYGYDFIDGDGDPMDESGHGTHCAGVIGAQGNNAIGVIGVNQNIRIMALRILNADGSANLNHEIGAFQYISKALDLGEPIQAVNNSWGADECSEIVPELINILGRKGAVTVAAAGNYGNNNDEVPIYPANIDSPYVISVAATNAAGDLASFSCYGEETVDVAAPGTDILSTYPFYCYNPSIYTADKQAEVSAAFNDYESETEWFSLAALKENLYLNGERYDPETYSGDQRITLSISEGDGFNVKGSESAHAILLAAENLKEKDLICISIPYEITADTSTAPDFSLECKAEWTSDQSDGAVGACEVPVGTSLNLDTVRTLDVKGWAGISNGDSDSWDHLFFQTLDEDELTEAKKQDTLQRELVLFVYAYSGGDIRVKLDDLGLSRENLDPEVFEKYE